MRFVDFTLARALGRQTLVIRTIVVLVVAGGMLLTMMADVDRTVVLRAGGRQSTIRRRDRAAGDEPGHP